MYIAYVNRHVLVVIGGFRESMDTRTGAHVVLSDAVYALEPNEKDCIWRRMTKLPQPTPSPVAGIWNNNIVVSTRDTDVYHMPIKTGVWHTTRTAASETRHEAASVVVRHRRDPSMAGTSIMATTAWHLIGGITPTTSSSNTHSVVSSIDIAFLFFSFLFFSLV
jgi:hypothetical protein